MVVCAVFVPIMFIAGQTGLLFRELAAAMIGAVAFSGFFALSLAPMLCSKLLKHEERKGFSLRIDRTFKRVEEGYARRLDRVLRKPLIPVAAVRIFLAGAAALFFTLQSELVPTEDAGIVNVNVNAPEGTGFAEMDRYMQDVQARLLPLVGEGAVRSLITRTPGSFGPSDDFNIGRGQHLPEALGGARGDDPGRGRPGQPDARPDRRRARQRRGPQLAEPRPRPAGQLRHRRRDLCRPRPRPRSDHRRGGGQSRHRQSRQRL